MVDLDSINYSKIAIYIIIIVIVCVLIYYVYKNINKSSHINEKIEKKDLDDKMNSEQNNDSLYKNTERDTQNILYYFYNNRCQNCVKFNLIWEELKRRYKNNDTIKLVSIDCLDEKNENLVFYYNIVRTPTLILVTPTKNIEFDGSRSVEKIEKFIDKNI